ncbi:MAG: radical SAM protein [Anaerolineae bacterium]|jgi:radical SAM protein with 4Fe4S-binding SPASM domain
MANLAISTICNQSCPYCFTEDHVRDAGSPFLPVEAFDERLDFLDRSEIDQARLMGGEPTLHPHLPELVARARSRSKSIVLFTNGLMGEQALACLAALPVEDCRVLVNVNQPDDGARLERQRATLRRLGQRALLGFNIYRADFEPSFLLSLISDTGCRPTVRLGLAHPCLSGENAHLIPHQYVFVGRKVVRFAQKAAEIGARVEFDCGFVRCMFSDAGLETLRALEADVGWRCNPILDVDVEGQVIHCYPLSQFASLPLTSQTDAAALRAAFAERTQPYRQAGIFPECTTCPIREAEECSGGCLALTMRRFRQDPFHLTIPVSEGGI